MSIEEVLYSYLEKELNGDYKKFNEKLITTKYEILGVKIPVLRKLSKKLLKEFSYQEILNSLSNEYFEYVLIKGLVIANCEVSYIERLKLIDEYLTLIDNWCICDIFVSELKFIKQHLNDFYQIVLDNLETNNAFHIRFSLVVLLTYYLNDTYIDDVLKISLSIKHEDYYVKMANSWLLSICMVKYFDTTINFMKEKQLEYDVWTYNKALQKGRESLRISSEKKDILKNLKIKNKRLNNYE